MIICHARELLFLKGRKVGGTAFELALATFCGPRDVITPLTPADEALRPSIGARGPQNHARVRWPGTWRWRRVTFRNHSPAAQVRAQVPEALWSRYRKVAIVRDPLDTAISRYYWRQARSLDAGLDFDAFVRAHLRGLTANTRIAPMTGPDRIDTALRYDRLEEDMAAIGLADVARIMAPLRPKSGTRPPWATCATIAHRHPDAARLIAQTCAEDIARHGFPTWHPETT